MKRTARVAIFVLSISCLAALATTIVLFTQLRYQRTENFLVRLDPLGQKVYENDPAPSQGAIVFFGDSRAQMWELPRIPRQTCITRGVGRQTTAQVLGRLEGDVLRLKPSCVVLECGINDLRALPLLPERRLRLKEDCVANLATMVETLRKNNISVVLCTIFPVQTPKPWQEPFWSDDIGGLVQETNTELRKLARDGVQILESEPLLAAADGQLRAPLAKDHLHLSPAGYERLNKRLVPLLKLLFKIAPMNGRV